jgi:hypothetical protein
MLCQHPTFEGLRLLELGCDRPVVPAEDVTGDRPKNQSFIFPPNLLRNLGIGLATTASSYMLMGPMLARVANEIGNGGDITVNASGSIRITGSIASNALQNGGAITLISDKSINLGGGVVSDSTQGVSGNITIEAGTGITLNGNSISAGCPQCPTGEMLPSKLPMVTL